MVGISTDQPESSGASIGRTHKTYLLANYILLGAASSAAFLTLSLRLIPSPAGLLLILLQSLTATACVLGLSNLSSSSSGRAHGVHMVATVLAAIFQGATAVLIFTRTYEFLVGGLRSYVRVDDGVVILKMVGGLCVVVFVLEWVVLALAFVLRWWGAECGVEGGGVTGRRRRSLGKVRCEGEETKDWPWPFQL